MSRLSRSFPARAVLTTFGLAALLIVGSIVLPGGAELRATPSNGGRLATAAALERDRPDQELPLRMPDPDVEVYPPSFTSVTNDTTFTLAGSPYVIADTMVVENGVTLTIEPGVVVKMEHNALLAVYGRMDCVGTPAQMISFEPESPGDRWLAVALLWADGTAKVQYTTFRGGSRATFADLDLLGQVSWFFSRLLITDCVFEDATKHHLSGAGATGLIARNTLSDSDDEAIDSNYNSCNIVDNIAFAPNLAADVIDYNFTTSDTVKITGNVIVAGLDDGLDLDGFEGTCSGNVITDCSDKGISVSTASTVRLENNIVTYCTKGFGITASSVVEVQNNTLARNGFGIHGERKLVEYGPVTIFGSNMLVWNNNVNTQMLDGSTLTLAYSNVGGGVLPGDGNLSVDPLFADPLSDFHLTPGSPCIDAGSADGAPELDFEGEQRRDDPDTPDTGTGAITYVDIGADEFQPISTSIVMTESPARPALVRVSPNPIARAGSITLDLEGAATGTLRLFDVRGRLLRTWEGIGARAEVAWDGTDAGGQLLARGVYFLEYRAASRPEPLRARVVVVD